MSNKFLFYLLFLIIPHQSFGEQFGATIVIQSCVGGYCSPNTSSSPLSGTGQVALDRARYEAYRYELSIEYANAIIGLQAQTQAWAEQKAKIENLTVPEYNKLVDQALKDLNDKIPDLPADLPTLEERRLRNPLPLNPNVKTYVEEELNEIWKSIEQQSPIKVAKDVNDVFEKLRYDSDDSDFIKADLKEKSDFLLKELVMSKVVNGDGIINAPFVEPMGVSLTSNPLTEAGFATRKLLNQNIATESLMRAKCMAGQESSENCAIVDEYASLMKLNFLATDRWASQFRPGRFETSRAFNQHLDDLKVLMAFGEGFVNGAVGAIDGIKTMILHPIDTVNSIGAAVYHYDKTYRVLQDAVLKVWDEYQGGDSQVRARILGEIGFEVVSALVPVSKIAALEKLSVASKGVRTAVQSVGKHVLEAGQLRIIRSAEQAVDLTRLVKNTLDKFPGEKIDKIVMSSSDYFYGWKKGWRHLETQSAEYHNAIMLAEGKEAGWLNGTKVFKFETTNTEIFHRVFNEMNGNRDGRWLLHKEDIVGLTPEGIKERYALVDLPTHTVEVHVPGGTSIYKGRIGGNNFGTTDGAIQYELPKLLDKENYINVKKIEGVVGEL